MHTDASGSGFGAVLYKHQGAFERASCSLKPTERNYPVPKLEFLTFKFHDYLYGTEFEAVWG